jgi:hypothetical protein
MIHCSLCVLGAAWVLGGCATSEKSVYERHLKATVKPSSSASALFIGATSFKSEPIVAAVKTE